MTTYRTSILFRVRRALKDWRWRRRIYAHAPDSGGAPVDREARDQLTGLLQALIGGEITNDQFEDAVPVESRDPAIAAIDRAAWCLYPDHKRCTLTGDLALDTDMANEVWGWMLFLQSDLKYEWHLPDSAPILSALARLFRAACPRPDHEEPAGEDVWPFVSVADLDRALAKFDDDPSGTN